MKIIMTYKTRKEAFKAPRELSIRNIVAELVGKVYVIYELDKIDACNTFLNNDYNIIKRMWILNTNKEK